jgi:hypothetical protein
MQDWNGNPQTNLICEPPASSGAREPLMQQRR